MVGAVDTPPPITTTFLRGKEIFPRGIISPLLASAVPPVKEPMMGVIMEVGVRVWGHGQRPGLEDEVDKG